MISSLERAAVVWANLESISGSDHSLEMIDSMYLKEIKKKKKKSSPLPLASDLSLEVIWIACHYCCCVVRPQCFTVRFMGDV